MFGGSKPAFGSTPSPAGFGAFGNATATPFGQSTFGKPATTGFGAAAPAFGNQNTSLFGASTQPSTGLFGAPAATPAFGQTATTQSYGFGQTTNSSSLFGGNAAPVASSSLFGAPATSSAFGQPAKASTFGFGSAQQIGSTGGGLFGQSASTQPTTGAGLFGQNAAGTSGGLFGSNGGFGSTGGVTNGTVVKFNAITGTDTMVKNGQSNTINTKHHCITCMKEYETKSLEELRLEDYMANRKGPQAGTSSAAGGMFGAPQQTAGGLFGSQQPATATGGMFGQQENKPLFGTTTTMGGFGSTAPAFGTTSQAGASGLFGKPLTGFGAQPATTTSAFTFNTNTTANPFGAGNKPFGAVAPQTSLFGQPATSTAFGAPTTGFGFGTATTQAAAPLFGAQKPATPFNMPTATNTGFGGFGAATTTTSSANLFGTKPATTGFGAPTTGFGAPAASTGFGSFGQTPAGGSLFNNTFNKPATSTSFGGFGATAGNTTLGGTGLSLGGTGGSLFGNTAAKPGGLFGSTATPSTGLFGNTGTQFGATGGLSLGTLGSSTLGGQQAQQASVPIHQQMMLMSQPFGDSPLFKNLAPASGKLEELLKPTNPAAQKAVMDSAKFKMSPASRQVKIKVKPISLASNPKKCLFDGLEEVDTSVEEAFTLKPSSKRLVLKPKKLANTSDQPDNNDTQDRLNNTGNADLQFNNSISNEPDITTEVPARRVSWLNTSALNREKNRDSQDRQIAGDQTVLENTVTEFRTTHSVTPKQPVTPNITTEKRSLHTVIEHQKLSSSSNPQVSVRNDEDKENISNSSESNQSVEEQPATENKPRHPTGIVLTRAGYYTIPALDDLIPLLSSDKTCIVSNFTVGREGYGNVYFNDSFDIANLNLDEIVHFRHKEVVIYPDDDNKPVIGQGLNRRAQVTLDRVWPHDKTRHEPITDAERLAEMDYEGKLRRVCAKHDTRFLEYRPQTGSWVFKVDHFSKYGLSDSEDEDDLPVDPKKVGIKKPVEQMPLKTLKQGLGGARDAVILKKNLQDVNMAAKTLQTGEAVNGQLNGHYHKEYMNGYDDMDAHANKYDTVFNCDEEDDDVGTTWMDYNVDNEIDGALSPSADLARQAGTNNYKVQLMKASFFIRDDDDLKSTSDIMEIGGRDTPDQIVPKGNLFRPNLQGMEQTFNAPVHHMIDTPQITPASTPYLKIDSYNGPRAAPLVVHPTTVILKNPGQIIPYEDTIMGKFNSRCLSDAAIFNGRRFRVGWALNNTFVSLTTQNTSLSLPPVSDLDDLSCYLQGRDAKDHSASVIQILKLADSNCDEFRESVEGHLEIQLKHSKFSFIPGSCPQITPQLGSLEEHCEMARALNIFEEGSETIRRAQYAAQVWDLLVALWGHLETVDGYDADSHLAVICRRAAFSQWLETWTNSEENSTEQLTSEEHLGEILNLLARHKVAEACNIAQDHGDHFLSLLLSQVSGGPLLRQLVQQQLSSWQEVDADAFINKNRLQILMLVAGVTLLTSSHGTLNVCEGLDWKRALGIHLWYICQPTASITDSLILYENAFSNTDNEYAYAPEPPYSNFYLPESTEHPVRDLCFHLLKLYSSKSYPLEALLNPATHTQDLLDYRLSWLLQQTLESLGYSHSSELSSCIIHTSFASQLEAHGMWNWAVFVLMHISNKQRREASILEVIGRHISFNGDPEDLEQETFILDSLHIPVEWVHRAKAIRAGSERNFEAQARHLIDAGMWNEAHQIIMEYLATEAVINGQHEYLIEFLEPLTVPDHCAKISNWSNQGQLLWDYITIDTEIQKLIVNPTNNIGYHLEQLQPQISSLCSRVKLFPCPTPKHVLCQCELAKRTATIARGLLMQSGREDVRAISRLITQLPLPEDYAQQELRLVVDGCLVGF